MPAWLQARSSRGSADSVRRLRKVRGAIRLFVQSGRDAACVEQSQTDPHADPYLSRNLQLSDIKCLCIYACLNLPNSESE
jgi:hypothetical protein